MPFGYGTCRPQALVFAIKIEKNTGAHLRRGLRANGKQVDGLLKLISSPEGELLAATPVVPQ